MNTLYMLCSVVAGGSFFSLTIVKGWWTGYQEASSYSSESTDAEESNSV